MECPKYFRKTFSGSVGSPLEAPLIGEHFDGVFDLAETVCFDKARDGVLLTEDDGDIIGFVRFRGGVFLSSLKHLLNVGTWKSESNNKSKSMSVSSLSTLIGFWIGFSAEDVAPILILFGFWIDWTVDDFGWTSRLISMLFGFWINWIVDEFGPVSRLMGMGFSLKVPKKQKMLALA